MIAEPVESSTALDKAKVIDRLVFGWWNTSLSPRGMARADENHKRISAEIVRSLIDDIGTDFLALGEVTSADLLDLKAACRRENLAIFDGTLKLGSLKFDTGIIYDQSRLSIEDFESIIDAHGNRSYKVANRINFANMADESIFQVFVCHWPSRATNEDTRRIRKSIAMHLRDKITNADQEVTTTGVIVLGDFNDEPFDETLAWHLLATRDRMLAQNKTGYFYNPFWKHLGESENYAPGKTGTPSSGTCYHRSGSETKWKTFDQIFFSSSFLGGTPWHLDEAKTFILRNTFLVNLILSRKTHFDHLPILGSVRKIQAI
jgi:hypothetical protein